MEVVMISLRHVLSVGLILAFSGAIASLGCTAEPDDPESTDESLATNGEDENIGEASQPITYNSGNCTCAASLTIRPAPGSNSVYCTVSQGTLVYAWWPPSGSWADVYVYHEQPWSGDTGCSGVRGWALKDYVSQLCCY